MGLLRNIFKSKEKREKERIYRNTKKSKCYIRVDENRLDLTDQDKRQIQFNNRSRVKGVYSGSYLPEDPSKLSKRGKKGG